MSSASLLSPPSTNPFRATFTVDVPALASAPSNAVREAALLLGLVVTTGDALAFERDGRALVVRRFPATGCFPDSGRAEAIFPLADGIAIRDVVLTVAGFGNDAVATGSQRVAEGTVRALVRGSGTPTERVARVRVAVAVANGGAGAVRRAVVVRPLVMVS